LAGRDDIKKPEDLIGRTVAYPRASGGHLYFIPHLKKNKLPGHKIKEKVMQAPEVVAALEHRDLDAFFLGGPCAPQSAPLVPRAGVLARWGDDGVFILTSYDYYSQGLIDDQPRAAAATRALIEATDFCNANAAEAAKVAAKAFRIPEADMKVYMSRMKYRVEMPKDVVLGNFRGAAEVALGEGIIKKMPDWNDFVRPQLMKEVAPDRAVGW